MDRQQLLEAPTGELADTIGQLHALITSATAVLCEVVEAFDAREAWAEDGASGMAAWLVAQLQMSHARAARLVAVARALCELPAVAGAFASAELSQDKVEILTRAAIRADEMEWIDTAQRQSVAGLARLAAARRPITREDAEDELARRAVWFRTEADGRIVRIFGRLPAAEGSIVQTALERIADQLPMPADGVAAPAAAQLADALIELASMRLAADPDTDRATIVIHADPHAIGHGEPVVLSDGRVVGPDTAERFACDARFQTVSSSGEAAGAADLAADRTRRTVPPWLRRILLERDGGSCTFPGCTHRRWLQHHHKIHFARGGPTTADNLITLCGHHHRLVHEDGWSVTSDADNPPVFRRPDGSVYDPRPPVITVDVRRRFPLLE